MDFPRFSVTSCCSFSAEQSSGWLGSPPSNCGEGTRVVLPHLWSSSVGGLATLTCPVAAHRRPSGSEWKEGIKDLVFRKTPHTRISEGPCWSLHHGVQGRTQIFACYLKTATIQNLAQAPLTGGPGFEQEGCEYTESRLALLPPPFPCLVPFSPALQNQ